MTDSESRKKIIVRAVNFSLGVNIFLSLLKLVLGWLSGSRAVIADGIDSLGDVLASLILLFTTRIINLPPNARHPYGYTKADTVAAKLVAFIILFAGLQLCISTVHNLREGGAREIPSIVAIAAIVLSIAGKHLLALYLKRTAKRMDSPMLKANARNMQNDVVISVSVLVGLVMTHVLKMPLLDSLTALAVSFWIIYVAIRMIISSSLELMDGIEDQGVYSEIIEAVAKVPQVNNPHRIRARKMAQYFMIALDVEVDGNLTLHEAHQLGHQVEEEIRKAIPSVYDVVVHMEPSGFQHPDEVFGVSKTYLKL